MDMPVALRQRKGRGAASNASGRFEAEKRVAFDDGWATADEEPAPLATTLSVDATRTIIARNDSPDIGFDRSINPYRGCEHGCIYCFARPTHSYLGMSPGVDFETKIVAKVNAAERLRGELAARSYVCSPINIGAATDAYQPIERKLGITRSLIEVMAACSQPRYGLIERSKSRSGESLLPRIDLTRSSITCVSGPRRSSSASWSSVPQPSS